MTNAPVLIAEDRILPYQLTVVNDLVWRIRRELSIKHGMSAQDVLSDMRLWVHEPGKSVLGELTETALKAGLSCMFESPVSPDASYLLESFRITIIGTLSAFYYRECGLFGFAHMSERSVLDRFMKFNHKYA